VWELQRDWQGNSRFGGARMNSDINITVMKQGNQTFVAIYTDEQQPEAMRTMGRWAANPDNPMNWLTAARMCNEMRKAVAECTGR